MPVAGHRWSSRRPMTSRHLSPIGARERVAPRLAGNDWQQNVRWVVDRVEHRLLRRLDACAGADVLARIEVAVEARKVGAGHVYPDAMAGHEHVARWRQLHFVAVHFARLDQLRCSATPAIPRATDPIS